MSLFVPLLEFNPRPEKIRLLAPAKDSSDLPCPQDHGDAQVFRVAFDRARQTLSKTLPDSEKAKNKE